MGRLRWKPLIFKGSLLLFGSILSSCSAKNALTNSYITSVSITANGPLVATSYPNTAPVTTALGGVAPGGAGIYVNNPLALGGVGSVGAGAGSTPVPAIVSTASSPAPAIDITQPFATTVQVNTTFTAPAFPSCTVNAPFTSINCSGSGFQVSSSAILGTSGALSINAFPLGEPFSGLTSNSLNVNKIIVNQALDTRNDFTSTDAISSPIVYNGKLFFSANNANGMTKLFSFDGTTLTQVTNILGNTSPDAPANLTVFQSKLYFSANSGAGRTKLFSYDDSTSTLTQISNTRNSAASTDQITLVAACGPRIYFSAFDSASHFRLYSFDGTTMNQITNNKALGDSISSLTCLGTKLYFIANNANATKVMQFDPAGPTLSQVSNTYNNNAASDQATLLTVYNNKLFFEAYNANGVSKIFSYDGVNLNQISNTRGNNSLDDFANWLAVSNNKLFFVARNANNATKLFSYDDVTGSLVQVSNTRGNNMANDNVSLITVANGKIYFPSRNASGAYKHYQYDDATNTLTQISNTRGNDGLDDAILSGGNPQFFPRYTYYNGRIYFWALANGVSAIADKLFAYDPAINMTYQVMNNTNNNISDDPGTTAMPVVLFNRLYLPAINFNSSSTVKFYSVCDTSAGCTN